MVDLVEMTSSTSTIEEDIEGKVPIESLDIGSYDLMVVRSKLFERNGVNTPDAGASRLACKSWRDGTC